MKTTEKQTISGIVHRWNKGSLIIPKVQRELVWTTSQKQLLIDSLLRDFDIPKLYWRKVIIEGKDAFEVVDGQQRINAIVEFLDNKYPLANDSDPYDDEPTAGKYYKDLSDDTQIALTLRNLDIVTLIDYTDEEMEETFLRLQNGTPLKAAEKRRAIQGNMRDVVADLAKHDFFESCCDFKNTHYAYEDMCAKTLCVFLNAGQTDIRAKALTRMYENNPFIKLTDAAPASLTKAYNFLVKAFKKAGNPHLKKYSSIDLPIVVSSMLKTYDLSQYATEFGKAYLDFISEYEMNKEKPEDDQDPRLVAYANAARGDSLEYLEYRQNLLREYILGQMTYLVTKDPTRDFTPEQRAVIYQRNQGICQKCGRHCDEDDFHADHIIPHSKGGETKIVNGQVLCPDCNLKKGSK